MEFINFVDENGKEELKAVYTPYIYTTMIECSNHWMIFSEHKAKCVLKDRKEKK